MLRVTTVLFALAIGVLFLAGCSPAAETEVEDAVSPAQSAAPAAINEATFTAVEYSLEGPESIPAGWTRLTLDNQGALGHDLIPVQLGEGKTVDDVMAALEAEGPPEWATIYGQVSAGPGQSASYLVDLRPGDYVLLSFGDSEDGPPDAAQGMITTLTVTDPESTVTEADLPQADATVELMDYSFAIDGDVERGEQLLHVSNSGTELHELVVFKLNEGVSFAEFQTLLQSEEEPEGGPPVEDVGGALLSPGVSAYLTLGFDEPGAYVLVCFLPSTEHEGMPHYELGMVQEITVP